MKRYSIYAAALSLAAIVSCQKEISDNRQDQTAPEVELESMTLSTGDAQSKTSVSGTKIFWTADDEIDIFSNVDDYGKKYTLKATEVNEDHAKFEGKVAAGTTDFYAVYPSGVASKEDTDTDQIRITVPRNQSPKADSFGEEMNVSVAKGTKTLGDPQVSGVKFYNVCSYLKFTVPSYVPDVEKVEVTCDRAIAGSTVVNYSELESRTGTITGFGDANTITMVGSFAAGSTFWFVLTPGEVKTLTIKLTTSNKSTWTRTSTKAFTLNIGKPKNLGTIDFALTNASAIHTKSGETLTGTEVNVNLGIISSLMNSVTAVNLQVANSSGEVVRTYIRTYNDLDKLTDNSVTIPADSSWPYLPQGDYTISGTYTVNGTTQNFTKTSFTSPAPTFTVNTPSAHTSYDTYTKSGASAANNEDGSTIYGIANNGVTISSDLLTKYESLAIGYSYTIDGTAATEGDNANQSWAAHNVVAKFTFDGVEIASAPLTCHVTGLPYKKDFTSDKGTDGWSGLNIDKNRFAVCLGYSYGSGTITYNAFSPSFNLPQSTNVKYTAIHYCGATGGYSPSGTICSGVTDNNTTVETQSKSISGNTWYLTSEKSSFTLEDSITMSSTSKISLSGSCEARRAVQNYVELARFEITYR